MPATKPTGNRVRGEKATIYDIARSAGVSPSTVSRALSKPGRVSAKTQKKIEDAAAELNYQVNRAARALPTGRTGTVGVIVSDITNPAYFNIVRGAASVASQRDCTLVLAESAESADTELTVVQRMSATVDGIVLASSRLTDQQILDLAAQKPLAVVNRIVDGAPSVVAAIEPGVTDAIRHLASLGHTSVAYVTGPELSWMSRSRWESIRSRCDWSGLTAVEVASGVPTVNGGRQAAAAVRNAGCTAVICYNDLMAIGLMQELQLAGVRIPEDLSILGFDNIFGSDFTTPPLSTIKSQPEEAGAAAVGLVLDDLDGVGGSEAHQRHSLATELVVRGSIGPAR